MNYRNAKYIDATRINCEINHPRFGWIPYTLNPSDKDMSVDNAALLDAMSANGNVASYAAPSQAELDAMAASAVRSERNAKLISEVDPIAGNALRWAELADAKKQAWADYRQALLDVPSQSGFPHEVIWPVAP